MSGIGTPSDAVHASSRCETHSVPNPIASTSARSTGWTRSVSSSIPRSGARSADEGTSPASPPQRGPVSGQPGRSQRGIAIVAAIHTVVMIESTADAPPKRTPSRITSYSSATALKFTLPPVYVPVNIPPSGPKRGPIRVGPSTTAMPTITPATVPSDPMRKSVMIGSPARRMSRRFTLSRSHTIASGATVPKIASYAGTGRASVEEVGRRPRLAMSAVRMMTMSAVPPCRRKLRRTSHSVPAMTRQRTAVMYSVCAVTVATRGGRGQSPA